jgi:hypothetical protein
MTTYAIASLRDAIRDLDVVNSHSVISIRDTSYLESTHPIERFRQNCAGMLPLYFDDIVSDFEDLTKPATYHIEPPWHGSPAGKICTSIVLRENTEVLGLHM